MENATDRSLYHSPFAINPCDQTRRIVQVISKELVMAGNLLRRLDTAFPGQSQKNMAVCSLFQHCTGLLNGIATTMSGGCDVGTCTCLTRALLDSTFSLKYIVLEKGQRRAAAYIVNFIIECMRQHEMTDPKTSEGQKAIEIINASEVLRGMLTQEPSPRCQRGYDDLKACLEEPLLAEVYKELETLKKARRRRTFSWHSLDSGPTSIRELAERVGMLDSYVFFYKDQSRFVHGTAGLLMGSTDVSSVSCDDADFHHMRMERLGCYVTFIALHLMFVVVENCFPSFRTIFEDWRNAEISPIMTAFSQNLHHSNRIP